MSHGLLHVAHGATAEGFRQALAHIGVELRYCARAGTFEMSGNGLRSREWRPLDERARAQIAEEIAKTCTTRGRGVKPVPLRFTSRRLVEFVEDLAPERDPFLEWLAELPEWDGRKRIDRLLDRFDADPIGPYNREPGTLARLIVNSAVARVFAPGQRISKTPLLIGRAGTGKTAFVESLMPEDRRPEWTAELTPLWQIGELRRHSVGRVLVELHYPEPNQAQRVWRFLDATRDRVPRDLYREWPRPRRFVVVATAQKIGRGMDSPRWTAVQLRKPGDPLEAGERDQVWAEAVHDRKGPIVAGAASKARRGP